MAFLSNSIHNFERRTHATLYYCVSAHIIDALNSRLADNVDGNRLQSQALYLTREICHERGLSANDDNGWCGDRRWFLWELLTRLCVGSTSHRSLQSLFRKTAKLVLMASDSLKETSQFLKQSLTSALNILGTSHLLHSMHSKYSTCQRPLCDH